jgi:Zn-dependent M28 family amino/carboxypeptidase
MLRRSISAAAAAAMLLGSWPAAAQQNQDASAADRIRADVTFLADDMLEGRGTGSEGYEIAARFLASRFMALGLAPGNQGSWYQRVPFAETRRKAGAPSFIRIGNRKFINGQDVTISASPVHRDQTISGEAVFVGFGLDAPAQGFDDYAGLDVRGKIVVALWGFPPGSPSEMAAHLNSDKARMAQERGAKGLLTIVTPTQEKIVPWDKMRKRVDYPNYTWVGPDGTPYLSAPRLAFSGNLGPKAAAALFANAPVPLAELIAQSEKQGARIKGFALAPRIAAERHSIVGRIASPNVIGLLRGSDPKLANEYIVLSGHLDAIGLVDPVDGDRIVNGAMDNASGIATMLEAARSFVQSGKRPRRSILFVGLAAEEKGLLGASYLAQHPVVGNGKVVGLVNLDMPTLTYDFKDVVAFGAEHSTIGSSVARAIAAEGVALVPDPEPHQVGFVRTDHYMFVKQGVPAVSLDTGPGNGGAAASADFIRNRYHEPGDDISQNFDWNAAAKFARINYLIARELADADTPPLWYAGDFFGETFAKDAPKAPR